MVPSIKLVAWESRDPKKVFVAIPNERGRYLLTDRCVIAVPCERCKATTGEPCKGRLGDYNSGTHYARRDAYTRMWPRPTELRDVLREEDLQPSLFEPD